MIGFGIFAAIWIACAALTGTIAKRKHRNGAAWFVGGLVVGPLLWIVVQFIGTAKASCAACHKEFDARRTICPHCKTPREPVST